MSFASETVTLMTVKQVLGGALFQIWGRLLIASELAPTFMLPGTERTGTLRSNQSEHPRVARLQSDQPSHPLGADENYASDLSEDPLQSSSFRMRLGSRDDPGAYSFPATASSLVSFLWYSFFRSRSSFAWREKYTMPSAFRDRAALVLPLARCTVRQ